MATPPASAVPHRTRHPATDAATILQSRTFPAAAREVSQARRFLASCASHLPLACDAAVCVSELATNADAPRGALSYSRRSREGLKGGSWALWLT